MAIVLPGTKSTIADLAWLRESGLAAAVLHAAAAGTPVIGICGGYQMLGRRIRDPERVESAEPEVPRARPARRRDDLRRREADRSGRGRASGGRRACGGRLYGGRGRASAAPLGPTGTSLRGYEIHMGRTTFGKGAAPLLRLRGADGVEHDDGAVAATGRCAAPTSTGSSTIRPCGPRF